MNSFVKNNSLLIDTQKYDPNKLVLVYDTSKEPANNTVSFPVLGSTPNITVNWGDGSSDVYTTTGWKTHTYSSSGIYIVEVAGIMRQLGFSISTSTSNNKLKLVRCLSFGNIGLNSLLTGFQNCTNLIECPASLPSAVTNLGACFNGCSNFNHNNITQWNTINITTFSQLFFNATSFNQNIGAWNTSNVTTIDNMFRGASSFNQPVGNWNLIKNTRIDSVFSGAFNFNQPVGDWNTSNVTLMTYAFNQAINFNQSLSNWNTTKVTNMAGMFSGATNFSSNLGSWNLSGLTTSGALSGFRGSVPTQPGFNTPDYDAILIGWNNNKTTWRTDLKPDFGGSKYSSAASAARAALVAFGWTINDGGMV